MKSPLLKLLGASVFAVAALSVPAQAATVGAPAVNVTTGPGSDGDSWSNFVLGLPLVKFTGSGTVTSWNVWTDLGGSLGMLLLRPTSTTNQYSVVGADIRTGASSALAGANGFTWSSTSGSSNVQANDILGLWIGTGKVDYGSIPGTSAAWCSNDGCLTDPSTDLEAGDTVLLNGPTSPGERLYSANVNVNYVPLPAAAWLFGSALLGLVAVARRRTV